MDRLAAMQTFVKVIDTGSFSAAARQLRIGQPAVSKMVAQLEERLGVTLLLRTSRSFGATEAGQIFYERAKLAITDADEAELAARGAGAGLVGRLRVSAGVTFARLKIVPKLGRLLALHPKLEIELILDDRNVDLVGEGVDIALRMGVLTDSALTARKIARIRRRVVGTPAYFARAGAPLDPRDLKRHEAIIYTQGGGGVAWTFVKDGVEESVALRGRIRSTAAEAIREAVLADLGLAVASDGMLGNELKSGSVLEMLPDWRLPSLDVWAVFPSGRRASAKAHAFAAFVEKELAMDTVTEG
jgi:DNA-binding transcriptional LysR family regulator